MNCSPHGPCRLTYRSPCCESLWLAGLASEAQRCEAASRARDLSREAWLGKIASLARSEAEIVWASLRAVSASRSAPVGMRPKTNRESKGE